MTAPLLTAEQVSLIYRGSRTSVGLTVLDEVSVAFTTARLHGIVGPSGSGKSTLLNCLSGLERPTSGRVLIDGIDLAQLRPRALAHLRGNRFGFVFQRLNLIPSLTARDNITLAMQLAGRRYDRQWLRLLVDVLGIGDRLDHHPSELSGGQQQRVAIARALLGRPDVVFADEPTGSLDSDSAGDVLDLLRTLVDALQQTIVVVTHDPIVAGRTDRVIHLVDGRIADDKMTPAHSGRNNGDSTNASARTAAEQLLRARAAFFRTVGAEAQVARIGRG